MFEGPESIPGQVVIQDMVDLLKTVCKSQPRKLSQVTNEKPISKASGIDGEQLPKSIMDDLNKKPLSRKFRTTLRRNYGMEAESPGGGGGETKAGAVGCRNGAGPAR